VDLRFGAFEVDDIVSIGQDDHIEARGGLLMGLGVVELLLGEESCESEFLVLFGHDFGDGDHV
jgi:hypothetical protein